ncbi:S-adenosyl-L-methionine-dependent methyltransferase [Russula dissimulans]|nr:S-adenosyl-L-methionine-dependent methyltransferase [Russula dissimulans]
MNIPKRASSVRDLHANPPFGSRFLTENADVWSQNAWDHVPPPADQDAIIAASLARQRAAPVPEGDKHKYNTKPAKHWDNFYKANASNFFKNRKWLHLEFPELVASAEPSAGPRTVVEVGCGAGNAILPLLAQNRNPDLRIHAFDYSSHAVKLVQHNALYISPPCGSITATVWDLASSGPPPGLAPCSADILVLVFVLSALHPSEWPRAISNIAQMLKPGGLVLMRDYGRHDLTQLRFKAGRLLDDNFYIRGDSTRVYFFELDELALLFTGSLAPPSVHAQIEQARELAPTEVDEENGDGEDEAEAEAEGQAKDERSTAPNPDADDPSAHVIHPSLQDTDTLGLTHPLFAIKQLGIDRRLLVNRKRQLKMYRVWMQGKFQRTEMDCSPLAAEP